MMESEYWIALEYRVCGEFAGMPERHLRCLWCDGFTAEHYVLDAPSPCIMGRAWICTGRMQDIWHFTLFLKHPASSPAEIDWASLLPPDDVTRWLAVDRRGKRLQIEPSAAVADAAEV